MPETHNVSSRPKPDIQKIRSTYGQRYACSNCTYSGSVRLPKGTRNHTKPCPNCGCLTFKVTAW